MLFKVLFKFNVFRVIEWFCPSKGGTPECQEFETVNSSYHNNSTYARTAHPHTLNLQVLKN